MKKIALWGLLLGMAGTVFSPVMVPTTQAQTRRVYRVLRDVEEYRRRVQACSQYSESGWAFRECMRGKPLVGLLETNTGLIDDVSSVGDRSIVTSTVWGRGGGVVVAEDGGYREERHTGPATRAAIGAGIAASIGGAVTGGWRGAVGGAGVGALAGLMIGRKKHSSGDPYFDRARSGEFELVNASPVPVEVFDGRKFIGRMPAGDTWFVPPPRDRYRAAAMVPNARGGISRGELGTHPTDNGWIFIEPAVARAGR